MSSRLTHAARSLDRGFTLLELMITVAIVAILAAVVYPAYTDSVLKGRRAEGRAALTEMLQQQERRMTQLGSYVTIDPAASAPVIKNYSGDNRAKAAYLLGARTCGGGLTLRDCVEVYANPTRSDAATGELRIRSSGEKTCTGTKPDVCWK